jgi:hypothetical protein
VCAGSVSCVIGRADLRVTWYQNDVRPKRERGPLGAGSRAAPRLDGAGAPRRVLSLSRIEGTHILHHAGYGLAAVASSDSTQGSYGARLRRQGCVAASWVTRGINAEGSKGRAQRARMRLQQPPRAGRVADNFIL